jgi:RNA polymerase sigma-70 factor (ECF subfamily)
MSDKALISAFTALRKKFLRMAMHILPSEDDAADALQDAFCRLWPRRDSIKSQAEAEALTTTTLRNICIDRIRKREIETVPIDDEHDRYEEGFTYKEREERFIEIKRIIDKELTTQQKEIIELKDIEGHSIEDIAKRLSSTESAVRMNLSRARKKIREGYRKEVSDE